MVNLTKSIWAVLLLALLNSSPLLAADEPPADSAAMATPEEIKQWVKELDADSFAARQAATRKLIAVGKAAIEETAKAAEGTSLEATTRALEVLAKLYQSGDAATKEAAKAALEKLKLSKNAAAARQAAKTLEPPAAPEATPPPGNVPALPGLPALPPGFPNVPMIPGGRVSVKTSHANGVKTVDIDENGKLVKIVEDANGITVTITEKVDGKDKATTYTAKDVEELKKKHPEAHGYYEKYAANNGLGIGNIQLRVGGGAFPIPVPVPRGIGAQLLPQAGKTAAQQKATLQLAEAQKQLESTAAELKKAAINGASSEDLKKLAERIESAGKQIAEAQKQFE